MAAKKSAKQADGTGNPFTLLAKAYQERRLGECLDLLTNIYVYLRRKTPPRSLRKQWKKTLSLPDYAMDFLIQLTGKVWRGMYYIRLFRLSSGEKNERYECYLDYSNEANAVGIDGHKSSIAKRGLQLIGMR